MELKEYQRRVLQEAEAYLTAAANERSTGNVKHASADAWDALGLGTYRSRKNGIGEDLPNFCIKVPTGGGKTLLATQILGLAYRTLLKERNGAGLVLWVVPSSQIYRDTLRRLRDRNDLYRLMLEHAVSRRIEVWEKHEILRLSPSRLQECLNILVLQLASTNRETPEQLKFFRDSGGNIVQHFPAENDFDSHKKLKALIPNLDMIEDDGTSERHLIATSVGNLVRLCKPPVILDEGHKATSSLARATIESFNAAVVVELSATPNSDANIVSRVSGKELLAEQMIKLPLNIATNGQKNWKDVLTQAHERRASLKGISVRYAKVRPDRQIRPVVLVQVERTGKGQRGGGRVHAKDVEEFLRQKLSVPNQAIRIKSAEDDGLENIDLMDPECSVEWIITKSALQEGWDCPFAYVLVSLNNTGSAKAMTQLVGRVLRQPYQELTPYSQLNESYIYCLHDKAADVVRNVKTALEREGYEGEAQRAVVDASSGRKTLSERVIRIRPQFSKLYTTPNKGKIYLPRFCVKSGASYQPLNYFEHLLGQVDLSTFPYDKIMWELSDALASAKNRFYRLTLGSDPEQEYEADVDIIEPDELVLAWIAVSLRFDFIAQRQRRMAANRAYDRMCEIEPDLKGKLSLVKFLVRDKLERFIQDEIDKQTEAAFGALFDAGKIKFYLESAQCRFQIPAQIEAGTGGPLVPLTHDDGKPLARSLFDFVEREGQNEYERAVALVLDRHADILWWFRNRVGPEHFTVQGYRRARIFPDFVVQSKGKGRTYHRVLVVESKGKHLEGNLDTLYKRNVARYFERAGKKVSWQRLGSEFRDHIFRFKVLDEAQEYGRTWEDELRSLLSTKD